MGAQRGGAPAPALAAVRCRLDRCKLQQAAAPMQQAAAPMQQAAATVRPAAGNESAPAQVAVHSRVDAKLAHMHGTLLCRAEKQARGAGLAEGLGGVTKTHAKHADAHGNLLCSRRRQAGQCTEPHFARTAAPAGQRHCLHPSPNQSLQGAQPLLDTSPCSPVPSDQPPAPHLALCAQPLLNTSPSQQQPLLTGAVRVRDG